MEKWIVSENHKFELKFIIILFKRSWSLFVRFTIYCAFCKKWKKIPGDQNFFGVFLRLLGPDRTIYDQVTTSHLCGIIVNMSASHADSTGFDSRQRRGVQVELFIRTILSVHSAVNEYTWAVWSGGITLRWTDILPRGWPAMVGNSFMSWNPGLITGRIRHYWRVS